MAHRLHQLVLAIAFALAAGAGRMSLFAAAPQVRLANPMQKIMIQGASQGFPYESWVADHYDLSLARYEHEGFQVVVVPSTALTNARVSVGTLVPQDGQGPFNGEVQVWLVGYVDVPSNPIDVIDYPAYLSNYHGWWPDALLTFQQTCNINANDRVPFWVDVSTQADTPPGNYTATISVTANGITPINLQLNVHVWDFALPVSSSLDTAFSCQTKFAEPLYGASWNETLHYKLFDIMLEHRLNVTELYRINGPIPFSYIQYWVSKGATSFCLGKIPSVMGAGLDTLVAQLVSADLLDKAYVYGYDEVEADMFEAMCNAFTQIHNDYPGLRTMTTARDYTFGQDPLDPNSLCLRNAVDIWVPPVEYGRYDQAEGDALRAIGKDMWWYTCCWPRHPYPNWFVECPAIEARLLMGAMTYNDKSSGFLYWCVARWLNDGVVANTSPITSGPYTSWDPRSFYHEKTNTWASGDGCLILPGPNDFIPTIRLENIRDGLEDYEYLILLEDLVDTVTPGSTPAEILFVAEANALLTVPIVDSVLDTHFTRDPDGNIAHHVNEDFQSLYGFRQDLANTILQGIALTSPTSPPTIFVHPSDKTVFEGASATYAISAGGGSPLSYQWQKNRVNLSNGGHYSGCTTATLTVSEVNGDDEASYRCVVTNPHGSATSNEATLTLAPPNPPIITQQPMNQQVILGGTADFTVAADGIPPISYQWQKNQVNLSNGGHYDGVTTATLTVSNANTGDEANYRCVVTNSYGSTNSDVVSLVVAACTTPVLLNWDFESFGTGGIAADWTSYTRAPINVIYTQPIGSESAAQGIIYQQIQTSYVADGGAGVYQVMTGCVSDATYMISGWIKTNSPNCRATVKCAPNGSTDYNDAIDLNPPAITTNDTWVAFSGQVTATAIKMTLFLDSQTYVSGSPAKAACFDGLTLACDNPPVPPTITSHPSDVTTDPGTYAEFYVTATGDGPLRYQWQKDQVDLIDDGIRIFGVNDASLIIDMLTNEDEGKYRCIVTGSCGSATSNEATLTVGSATANPGDFDGDGDVDLADFGKLQACLNDTGVSTGCDDTDVNNNNAVDAFDLGIFLGCLSGADIPALPDCAN